MAALWGWGTMVAAIVLALAFAPLLAPFDPARQDLLHRFAAPSAAHWLGSDHLGRDTLSRLLFGGRFSVSVAAISLAVSLVVGVAVGVASARAGGWRDEATMRLVDMVISFPEVVVALVLVALLGTSDVTLVLAMSVTGWTPFARMTRALALDIFRRDFVRAAEILGCSRVFVIRRHVVPNVIRPLAAVALLRFGHKLITVGGLSFLGLGVQPPFADWGSMLAESRRFMERSAMLMVAPGLAIFVTALSVTMLGQALEARRDGR